MRFWQALTRTEKSILTMAVLLLLIVLLYFFRSELGGRRNVEGAIGAIEVHRHDVRLKSNTVFQWNSAQKGDAIAGGDSLFAGEKSSARVKMKDGQAVDVGENSLVHFVEDSGQKLPNLKSGNFRLKVDGTLRIAVNGKITNVRGRGSEVQVVVTENAQPRLKLLKGRAEVSVALLPSTASKDETQKQEAFISLVAGQESRIDLSEAPVVVEKAEAKIEPPVAIAPTTVLDSQPLPAPPEIADSETVQAEKLSVALSEPVVEAPVISPVEISYPERVVRSVWKLSELYSIQGTSVTRRPTPRRDAHTETLVWKPQPVSESYRVELATDAGFNHVFGLEKTKNIRYSFNPQNDDPIFWRVCANGLCSQTGTVRFQTVFNDQLPAQVFESRRSDASPLVWTRQAHDLSYLIESSPTADFTTSKLQISPRPIFNPAPAPNQSVFVRVARVQDNMELSEFSGVMEIKGPPEIKIVPIAEIKNSAKPPVKNEVAAKVKLQSPAATEVEPAREPSSIDANLKVQLEPLNVRTNDRYRYSGLIFEGASVFQRSSEQSLRNEAMPNYFVAGFRARHWREELGFEAGLRSQVFSVNGPGEQHQALTFDARVIRRWSLPFRTFSFLRELQLAPYIGAELYRNRKTTRFSPAYDLLKAGVKVDFPVFDRWSTGGEFGAGYGLDKSQKFDLGGFLKFYLEAAVALGGGYRVHLFEAGSTSSAPAGVPYREAYGEAYMLLEWNY